MQATLRRDIERQLTAARSDYEAAAKSAAHGDGSAIGRMSKVRRLISELKEKLLDADALERAERIAAQELALANDGELRKRAYAAGVAALARREDQARALLEACSLLARHYCGVLDATRELRETARAGGRELVERMDSAIASDSDLNTFVLAHLFLCGAGSLVGQAGAVWAADVRQRGLLEVIQLRNRRAAEVLGILATSPDGTDTPPEAA